MKVSAKLPRARARADGALGDRGGMAFDGSSHRGGAQPLKSKPKPSQPVPAKPSPPGSEQWNQILGEHLKDRFELSARLVESRFGVLRKAKISAWYLLDGKWNEMPLRGGYSKEEHKARFWAAFSKIDKELQEKLQEKPQEKLQSPGEIPTALLQFVVCLYYLRSARAFAWDMDKGLARLRLVDAAAASANRRYSLRTISTICKDPHGAKSSLTDGGVHDNTGIKALMDEECTDIIVKR
jgi:hypothetical protein